MSSVTSRLRNRYNRTEGLIPAINRNVTDYIVSVSDINTILPLHSLKELTAIPIKNDNGKEYTLFKYPRIIPERFSAYRTRGQEDFLRYFNYQYSNGTEINITKNGETATLLTCPGILFRKYDDNTFKVLAVLGCAYYNNDSLQFLKDPSKRTYEEVEKHLGINLFIDSSLGREEIYKNFLRKFNSCVKDYWVQTLEVDVVEVKDLSSRCFNIEVIGNSFTKVKEVSGFITQVKEAVLSRDKDALGYLYINIKESMFLPEPEPIPEPIPEINEVEELVEIPTNINIVESTEQSVEIEGWNPWE